MLEGTELLIEPGTIKTSVKHVLLLLMFVCLFVCLFAYNRQGAYVVQVSSDSIHKISTGSITQNPRWMLDTVIYIAKEL